MKITILGKTLKGKNVISRFGNSATIVCKTHRPVFAKDAGNFAFIEPHGRWIDLDKDNDFIVKLEH